MKTRMTTTLAVAALCTTPALAGNWVDFADETSTRMPTPLNDPALSTVDTLEKDYAWGDVDQDGDVDLVCVRKVIGSFTGSRVNVLFMNEGKAEGHAIDGVLVDRTAEYASASDVPGDMGFNTPTTDRDVMLHDVNGDGWLDIITASTYGDLEPDHVANPRVYINLGEEKGVWQGFLFEAARTPGFSMPPNFCGVGVGDLNDDGHPDLYFGDYRQTLEDRLLINDGNGFFTDETEARTFSDMVTSSFTSHTLIADINNDGFNDIVKSSSLGPYRVSIAYNDPNNPGFFTSSRFDVPYSGSSYFVNVGDLNGDGLLDLIETDDGSDKFFLNQGNDATGEATFLQGTFPNSSGFGSNSIAADLNRDGLNDVLIADVDVDFTSCGGRTKIFHNLGGSTLSFAEDVANIPLSALDGTHDIATFDINGDNWIDLVIGTCDGTRVFINQPPVGIEYEFPNGRPDLVPTTGTSLTFNIFAQGGKLMDSTAKMFVSTNDGRFSEVPLKANGGPSFTAQLPGGACADRLSYYFSAELDNGSVFTNPASAPGTTYEAVVADDTEVALDDDVEGDTSAWQVVNVNLTGGAWEAADPNATISGSALAAPDDDNTPGGSIAFVTQNGAPGGAAGAADVDGGPTRLVTPTINLSAGDARISFARWMFTSTAGEDFMTVDISNNNGGSWTAIPALTTSSTGSAWETVSFFVGDYITPTAQVRLRFNVTDVGTSSVVEGGIDDLLVERLVCDTVVGDLTGDDCVNQSDLGVLLAAFNVNSNGDLTGDGMTTQADLGVLLANFGAGCP